MISGIYCIENTTNGRVYIGQSTDIKKRWIQHKSDLRAGRHDNEHLQRSWSRYGEDVFLFSIVEEVDEEHLDVAEMQYIKMFDAFHHGYNMTLGGDATRGYIPWNKGGTHSDETKKKLSKKAKEKIGAKNPFYGKRHSEITREKLRTAHSQPVIDPASGTIYYGARFADKMFNGKSSNVSKVLNDDNLFSAYGIKWERY